MTTETPLRAMIRPVRQKGRVIPAWLDALDGKQGPVEAVGPYPPLPGQIGHQYRLCGRETPEPIDGLDLIILPAPEVE